MAIKVTGRGEASGAPDMAEISVGISVLADSVESATETAAAAARMVADALGSHGVEASDLTTTRYDVQPEYDYSGNRRRLLGQRVSNMVTAKLRDLEQVGAVLDAATGAGGDHTVVEGVRFGIEDPSALEAEARRAAWSDALAKATQLAQLSGLALGVATSITETASPPAFPIRLAADAARAESSPPIRPGATTVSVSIEVEFSAEAGELEGPGAGWDLPGQTRPLRE